MRDGSHQEVSMRELPATVATTRCTKLVAIPRRTFSRAAWPWLAGVATMTFGWGCGDPSTGGSGGASSGASSSPASSSSSSSSGGAGGGSGGGGGATFQMDTATRLSSIQLPGAAVNLAYDGSTKRLWALFRDATSMKAGVVSVDGMTDQVGAAIATDSLAAQGLGVVSDLQKVYVGTAAGVDVIDATSGQTLTSIALPDKAQAIAVNADEVFVLTQGSAGDAEVYSIDATTDVATMLADLGVFRVAPGSDISYASAGKLFMDGFDGAGSVLIGVVSESTTAVQEINLGKAEHLAGVVGLASLNGAVATRGPSFIETFNPDNPTKNMPLPLPPGALLAHLTHEGNELRAQGQIAPGAPGIVTWNLTAGTQRTITIPGDGSSHDTTARLDALGGPAADGGKTLYVDLGPDPDSMSPAPSSALLKVSIPK
jgi:hypothetical protein